MKDNLHYCEATMLNRVSIFPKNGGIEEFLMMIIFLNSIQKIMRTY